MANLTFYYAAMNTGKSASLLQYAHGFRENNQKVMLFTTRLDNRFGKKKIISRIGLEKEAVCYGDDFNFKTYMEDHRDAKGVFVDEAQFLTKEHVEQLAHIVDIFDIDVYCYGLRSDFQGEPFSGSLHLLVWADRLLEIPGVCFCGDPCSMHLRVIGEKVTKEGPQILIGGSERHHSVCRKHFFLEEITTE
ncbi:MAG: thymidine kinase [Alphaproteobacteria bacterium]|nr:thymidine kinase [Alphaproteobacteria bacterium]